MLRYLSSVLTFILLLSFILSCEKPGIPSAGEKLRNENVLRYDVSAPFTSLNPTEVYASGSTIIFPLLYSYLFVPNGNGKLEPDLAIKWTYDPKGLPGLSILEKTPCFMTSSLLLQRM